MSLLLLHSFYRIFRLSFTICFHCLHFRIWIMQSTSFLSYSLSLSPSFQVFRQHFVHCVLLGFHKSFYSFQFFSVLVSHSQLVYYISLFALFLYLHTRVSLVLYFFFFYNLINKIDIICRKRSFAIIPRVYFSICLCDFLQSMFV